MLNYNTEISKPKSAEDFEEFCLIVYRVVFGDPTATKNGRSGQKQYGVDIFAHCQDQRFGIQCKRVTFSDLTEKIIDAEVASADKGKVPITELIISTTATNDEKLIRYAENLSDKRKADGRFTISLAFWDTLESFVRQHAELQFHFSPNTPGGAFYKFSQEQSKMVGLLEKVSAAVPSTGLGSQGGLPEARHDSLNKVITSQLDDIRKTILVGKFRDALDRLTNIGASFDTFDMHQRFRWRSQRALCYWRLGNKKEAAAEYECAHDAAPTEDKAAANWILASLLVDLLDQAVERANIAVTRFPVSPSVWSLWVNAHESAGHAVDISAVPPEIRDNHEVLHAFAWAKLRRGKHREAVNLASQASIALPDSFDARGLFLVCAVGAASSDPIRAGIGAPISEDAAHLEKAINAFNPLREKLWSSQDAEALPETVLHLAYAFSITGRNKEAIELLREGIVLSPQVKYLNRALLECLQRNDQTDDAYKFGLTKLDLLDAPGLAMLAELAANRGDIETVQGARERLAGTPERAHLEDDIEALYWLALWKSNKAEELIRAIADANLENSTSITKLSVAARIFNRIPEKKEGVVELLNRMKNLVREGTPSGSVLQAAEAFLACKNYDEAVKLYEMVVPKGAFSELHEKLLYALIQSGSRRKAFALIKAAPSESLFSENFRHLAIELAQAANDWAELCELSELELNHNRTRADAWLFRGIVCLNERQFDPLRKLLADAPIELNGTPRTIAGLANLDIRFGDKEKGIARLYRRFREDLGNSEAAVTYFALSATAPLPLFQESIDTVSPDTSVQLRVDGQQRRLTIDPVAAGPLPQHPDFTDSNSEIAKQLLGRKVGDRVSIAESFGFVREYEITGMESAYLALGRHAGELIHSSVKPVKGMLSVPVPTGEDGKPDFRHIIEQLKSNSERIKAAFETYGEGTLTLGILAQAIGTTTPILVNDWPVKPSPYLYVWSGKQEELVTARALLKERSMRAVIDLLTVSELVLCECEAVLAPLAPVLIAQSSVDTIAHMIEEAKEDQSLGNMREENGQIVLIENTDTYKARRLEILVKIQKCLNTHCRPLPVYGPEAIPTEIQSITRVLDHESSDAILLALEHQAHLITLDGRLREFANKFGKISGVWPQILMTHALEQDTISSSTYFYAVFRQLCTRRAHVSLGPNDLGWLLQQGDGILQAGMRAVKEHLSDPRVHPTSAFTVVAEIIERMPRSSAQLGAIGEIVEHLLAAVFSHPDLNKDAAIILAEHFVDQAVTTAFASTMRNFFEAPRALQRREAWQQYLVGAVRRASEFSSQPLETIIEKPLKVRNLFCSTTPRLVFTGLPGNAGQLIS